MIIFTKTNNNFSLNRNRAEMPYFFILAIGIHKIFRFLQSPSGQLSNKLDSLNFPRLVLESNQPFRLFGIRENFVGAIIRFEIVPIIGFIDHEQNRLRDIKLRIQINNLPNVVFAVPLLKISGIHFISPVSPM